MPRKLKLDDSNDYLSSLHIPLVLSSVTCFCHVSSRVQTIDKVEFDFNSGMNAAF